MLNYPQGYLGKKANHGISHNLYSVLAQKRVDHFKINYSLLSGFRAYPNMTCKIYCRALFRRLICDHLHIVITSIEPNPPRFNIPGVEWDAVSNCLSHRKKNIMMMNLASHSGF